LYEALEPLVGKLTIGFADDTNFLAFAKDRETYIRILEKAWEVASQWALERGMQFGPFKSELIHFTRGRLCQTPIRLRPPQPPNSPPCEPVILAPKKDARFLGVWIDSRLSFAAHIKAIKGKMETQMHALTRLAASTWGYNLIRAREIYVKIIRAAMAYGAGAIHDPNQPKIVRGL